MGILGLVSVALHMKPIEPPEGEFHHFQLVNAQGEVPVSVSILIHINPKALGNSPIVSQEPIGATDIIELHDALQGFNGDFISAFSTINS